MIVISASVLFTTLNLNYFKTTLAVADEEVCSIATDRSRFPTGTPSWIYPQHPTPCSSRHTRPFVRRGTPLPSRPRQGIWIYPPTEGRGSPGHRRLATTTEFSHTPRDLTEWPRRLLGRDLSFQSSILYIIHQVRPLKVGLCRCSIVLSFSIIAKHYSNSSLATS